MAHLNRLDFIEQGSHNGRYMAEHMAKAVEYYADEVGIGYTPDELDETVLTHHSPQETVIEVYIGGVGSEHWGIEITYQIEEDGDVTIIDYCEAY